MNPKAQPAPERNAQSSKDEVTSPRLRRHASGLMALEPRFMFDGAGAGQLADATALALDRVDHYLATVGSSELGDIFDGGGQTPPAWLAAAESLRETLGSQMAALQVQTVDSATLHGAWGAFAAQGPGGQPVIYLNADWLAAGAATEDVARVLVEEMGHAIDAQLNPQADSTGDEGELFSTHVFATAAMSDSYRAMLKAQDDHRVITVDGQQVAVEFAALNFTNAYAVYTSSVNGNIFLADKEQNRHHFNPTLLGVASISDGTNGQSFSGNDISVDLVIGGTHYYGWISRPIKDQGVVRGFYFWKDSSFTSLSAAQTDGNQDRDGTAADNSGFILVVDQTWFNSVAFETGTSYKFVGSSSDRVDTALNSVMPANGAPAPVNDSKTIAEDSGLATGNVLTNDTDPNNDTLTVTQFVISGTTYTSLGTAVTIASVGSFTLNADGSYSFTPAANYTGTVPPITYTVSDGQGGTATAVLSITVTPVSDLPTGGNDTATTPENTALVLGLGDFGSFSDPDGDSLAAIKITSLATNGVLQYWTGSAWASVDLTTNSEFTVADVLAGKLRFLPDTDENGANYATIAFKVKDSSGSYSAASYNLVVTVSSTNTAPVANADNTDGAVYAVEQGATVAGSNQTGNVLTNDTDADGAITAGTTHWVNSATSAALTTQVTVTQASTSTSSPASVTGLYGTLKLGGDGSYIYEVDNANAQVQALLSTSNTLTETFTYTMRDSTGATASSTLKVVMKGSNDAPVAVDDRDSVQETSSSVSSGVTIYGTTSGNVIPNDTDVDSGDLLSIAGSYAGATGSSAGTTTVSLTGSGLSSINTNDYVYINGASPQLLTVGGVAVRVSTSSNGQITLDNSNALRVNDQSKVFANGDTLGFYNTATYSGSGNYKVATYSGSSVAASTTVSVSGITGAISQGMTVTVGSDTRTVTALTYDANGAVTQITLNSSVTWQNATLAFSASPSTTLTGRYGTLTLASDGGYIYKLTSNALNSGQSFVEQFSYRVKDLANTTDDGILYIRVDGSTGVTMDDESASTSEDTTLTVLSTDANALLTGDSGVTTVVSFTWGTETKNAGQTITIAGVGDLRIDSDGGYVFTPASNYTGPVPTAIYNATDGLATPLATGSGQLSLSINSVNDRPTGINDAVTTLEDTSILLRTTDFGTFSDAEGATLAAVQITSLPAKGTLEYLNGATWTAVTANQSFTAADLTAGKLRYTPVANENGSSYTSLGFKVSDNTDPTATNALSASSYTLTVNVTPVNDAPVNTVPGDQTVSENGTLAITGLSVNDVDDPTDISSVTLSVTHGTLSLSVSGSGTISGGGTATVTLTGSKSELDAMLATLSYAPTAGYAGADALKVVTTDAAGEKDTDYVAISVGADSRALTVTGTTVNEASAYVRFNVDGEVGQRVRLVLAETANAGGNATIGVDFLPNLQYFNGTNWVDYTGGFVTIPSTLDGGASNTSGLLLVRTAVLQDSAFETTQAGYETLQLTAYNASGAGASATSQIRDDGAGAIYLAANNSVSTPSANPTYLDDDSPVSVNNLAVNEGSPWAIFTVTGTIGQKVGFSLSNGSATKEDGNGTVLTSGAEDFGPDLEVWDPSANSNAGAWVSYTAGNAYTLAAATTYVRTAVNPDTLFEGQHNFFLGVTRKAAGDTKYGTGNIYDDGTGVKYDGTFSGASPSTSSSSLDDDRSVSVDAPVVNEASDYVVFTVSGNSGQTASLRLVEESGSGKADIAETQTLKIWDGYAWINYDSDNLPAFDANGKIFVRASITAEQESDYEGSETFKLEARLSGQSSWAPGTATIKDDGTGVRYPGTFTNGAVDTSSTGLDDDRALTVNNPSVNEGSPFVVFEVTGISGDTASLSLSNASGGGSSRADLRTGGVLPTIQVLVSGAWVDYDPSNPPVVPNSGPIYVRVAIDAEQESALDGPETFKLVATNAANQASRGGTATISDDGTGGYFAASNTSGTSSVPAGVTLDDDRPVDPALVVSDLTVNEGSPFVVFEVTGTAGQTASLALANASGGSGSRADLRSQGQLPTLQYYAGGLWNDYNANSPPTLPAGGRLLVRVAIDAEQESAPDGPETFKLVATNASNLTSTGGTATIVDDCTGSYFAANNNSATSNVPAGATLDDDRRKAPPPKVDPPPPPMAPPAAPPVAAPEAPARPVPAFSSALVPASRAPAATPDVVVPIGDALTSNAGFRVVVNASAPAGLTVYRGITDQFVEQGGGTKVSLPYDAFIHSKEDAVIRLNAKNADDSPLPAWVRFDPATGSFDVTPPAGFVGRLDIKVTARDEDGREATSIFRMFVGEQQGQPPGPQSRDSFSEKLRQAARRSIARDLMNAQSLPANAEMVDRPAVAQGRAVPVRAAVVKRVG